MEADEKPTVLDLIRRRQAGEKDDYKLALSIEGGGMRGIVSGAMLIALDELGLTSVFDVFYGTSSGGINLAYFAQGCSWDALSIYYRHLVSGFVRQWPDRLYKPILDMQYVYDAVWTEGLPLLPEVIRNSPLDTRIVLADLDTIRPKVVKLADVHEQLLEYLSAGSWLPVLAGGPYKIGNKRYLDGGLLFPDPSLAAVSEGCTHLLMLNTRAQAAPTGHNTTSRQALRFVLNRWQSGLGDAYTQGRREWDEERKTLPYGKPTRLKGAECLRLAPKTGAHSVSRLTLEEAALLEGARAGYETVMSCVNGDDRTSYFALKQL